jgi:gp16 family phage-associated protein
MANSSGSSTPQSATEVRKWFFENGVSVTDWAKKNGFPRSAVYAALSEKTRGFRGQAHLIALALGLKKAPINDMGWSPNQGSITG